MAISKLEKLIETERLTEQEVITIIKGAGKKPVSAKTINISRKKFKYMYFADAHIGHDKFKPDLWEFMVKLEKKYSPDFAVDIGDHLEGMSNRPGHIYELTHIGFQKQINYAAELYNELKSPIYGIDGNHDGWYEKKANGGLVVGKELELRVKKYTHLGQMEGDLVVNGIKIKLFHANDGTAYAHSYKLQKLIESFSGGEKPNIVKSGHYHKALEMFSRNVYGFECGTLMGQSRWMRGKKIQACMGFGFVTVYYGSNGINRLEHEFVPYYEVEDKGLAIKV